MASPVGPEYQAQHPLSMERGGRAADWFQANARAVGIAGVAIALAAVGAVAWRSSERAKAQRAETALYRAQAGAAGGGDVRQAERALREVATRYAGTAGGFQAQLLLVQGMYESGRYQEGLTQLGRAKAPAEFQEAAELLRAAGLEGAGRGAEAGRVYEALARKSGLPDRRRDELRAAAARAFALGNDRAAALRLWKEIAKSEKSGLLDEARIRIGELSQISGA